MVISRKVHARMIATLQQTDILPFTAGVQLLKMNSAFLRTYASLMRAGMRGGCCAHVPAGWYMMGWEYTVLVNRLRRKQIMRARAPSNKRVIYNFCMHAHIFRPLCCSSTRRRRRHAVYALCGLPHL